MLYVRGITAPPLPLRAGAATNDPFVAFGFERLAGGGYLIREIEGVLGGHAGFVGPGDDVKFDAWSLVIADKQRLRRGNSGAPILAKSTGDVVAVISHQEEEGKGGLAYSIESLSRLDSLPVALGSLARVRSGARALEATLPLEDGFGGRRVHQPIPLDLVPIPEGPFLRGSNPKKDKEARSYEQPQREIYLSGYWIARFPITQAQFAAFVEETGHVTTAEEQRSSYVWTGTGTGIMKVIGASWRNPTGPTHGIFAVTGPFGAELVRPIFEADPPSYTSHPVVQVSWHDAVSFCKWLSDRTGVAFRLPTEAEWEKAARGSDGRIYPWGNRPPTPSHANYNDMVGGTTPVGSYPAGVSPYGAYDMIGNVWEWCYDWYDAAYFKSSPPRDPTGPVEGELRVYKGGAYGVDRPWGLRCADRYGFYPYGRYTGVGFRVVAESLPDD